MRDLIFLSQRIPYPPNKGDKVRSWNLLRRLAEHYRVHLACFVDDPFDWRHEETVRAVCESALIRPLSPFRAKVRSLRALATGESLTRWYFHDAAMAAWLDEQRARLNDPHVFVFSSGVASYVAGPAWQGLRRVVDMVDVDSDKWRQYANRKSGPARWIYGREADKLFAFERSLARATDATLFVSDKEAELFRDSAPEVADKVHVVRNGVDAAFFDPAETYEDPYPDDVRPIVFTGAMDYWPNVDAVVWYARDVLPAVREAVPAARFYIAGANPTREVEALRELPGVTVTGRVADIRPYIAHADTVVAPLRVARGVQNKVLEGMAMAKPVVATTMALNGIVAFSGNDLTVADDAGDFAAKTVARLGRTETAEDARRYILTNYSWEASVREVERILESD
ncbi:MAG: sugar transferase [Rhodospirillaceae bacterium]|nr:sugar transferase [Rhodospirillaceae bacterium]